MSERIRIIKLRLFGDSELPKWEVRRRVYNVLQRVLADAASEHSRSESPERLD